MKRPALYNPVLRFSVTDMKLREGIIFLVMRLIHFVRVLCPLKRCCRLTEGWSKIVTAQPRQRTRCQSGGEGGN